MVCGGQSLRGGADKEGSSGPLVTSEATARKEKASRVEGNKQRDSWLLGGTDHVPGAQGQGRGEARMRQAES